LTEIKEIFRGIGDVSDDVWLGKINFIRKKKFNIFFFKFFILISSICFIIFFFYDNILNYNYFYFLNRTYERS
jgi:hypothetical protein